MPVAKQTVLSEHFFQRFSALFAPYLEQVGISPDVLQQADIEIPEASYVALWEAVADGERQDIALSIGDQIEPADFGPMGHAFSHAPNVRQALEVLSRYISIYAQASEVTLQFTNSEVRIAYQVTDPGILFYQQDSEFAISAILRLLRLGTRLNMTPLKVDFSHPAPRVITEHQRIFACPVNFNQSSNRLCFSADILELPLVDADPRLFCALQPYLDHQRHERQSTDPLLPNLRRLVIEHLPEGVPELKQLSKQLLISTRTLQRRLQSADLDYQQLVEEIRKDAAIAYISKPRYSITEIGSLLGYAETSGFSRAFRRWTGLSPKQYRDAQIKQ